MSDLQHDPARMSAIEEHELAVYPTDEKQDASWCVHYTSERDDVLLEQKFYGETARQTIDNFLAWYKAATSVKSPATKEFFFLFVDGDQYDWPKSTIGVDDLRVLAAIPEKVEIWRKVPNRPDEPVGDNSVTYLGAPDGPVRFSTQPPGSQAGALRPLHEMEERAIAPCEEWLEGRADQAYRDGYNLGAQHAENRARSASFARQPRCPKAPHDSSGGYLHDADDDRPYSVDGLLYCGHCHCSCDASGRCENPKGRVTSLSRCEP